jgi:hypothetical protein
MTKLHMQDCHTSGREKMAKISGSPKNFESQSDKAERFCRGGFKDGGKVDCSDHDADDKE